MDNDGGYTYSNTVLVKRGSKSFEISNLYPVPSNDIVNLDVHSPEILNTQIIISDITGKQVKTLTAELSIGDQTIPVHIDDLDAGTYFISMN